MTEPCPTEADLQAFNGGDLPEQQLDEVAAHVERCPRCEQMLATLERTAHGVEAVLRSDTDMISGSNDVPAFIGSYQVLGELGRGGMSVVYRARQTGLGRVVALKMLLGGYLADAEQRARFRGEAEALARLSHPNIVSVYEVGEHAGVPFFTLEYVEGGNLGHWLEGKPQPPRAAARWLVTLARAVQHAHEQGIVHRDLKPANILLSSADGPDAGTLKIADFGIAKLLEGSSIKTASGLVVGTPEYMAPEQCEVNAQVGPAIDVYALGALLYNLLTGRPPFQASSSFGTLLLLRAGEPISPARLVPGVPRDLETICLKCLRKEPAQRYATAGELADELERFLEHRPILARPVGRAERLWRWGRRRPDLAGLLAALVLVVVAAFSGLIWAYWSTASAWRGESEERQAAQDARDQARQARDAEQLRSETAENNLYHSRVVLAERAFQANDVSAAERLLEQCLPATGQPDRRGWEWFYVNKICHAEQRVLRGHPLDVYHVAFSPNGKVIASAGGNPYVSPPDGKGHPGEAILWDVATGARLHTLRGHGQIVRFVAFSPDGKVLASSTDDATVRLWEVATGKPLGSLSSPAIRSAAPQVQFGRNGKELVGLGADAAVVWDLATLKEVHRFHLSKSVYSPATGLLAGFAGTGEIQVHDAASAKLVHRSSGGSGWLALSPDGKRLATTEPSVGWQSLAGGNWTRLPTSGVLVLDFAPGGRFLVSRHFPGWLAEESITVHDLRTAQVKHELHVNGGVTGADYSADGKLLATATADKAVRVWDLAAGRQQAIFRGHMHAVTSVAFQPGGRLLASASFDGTVRLWDLDRDPRGIVFAPCPHGGGELLAALAWRDGDILAVDVHTSELVVSDGATGRERSRHALDLTRENIWPRRDIAFSADGRRLAGPSGKDNRVVKVWDTTTGREVVTLPQQKGKVFSVAFSPDGQRFALADVSRAAAGYRSEVRIWDTESWSEYTHFIVDSGARALAFSPDGGTLASAGVADGVVRIHDADSGALLKTLRGCKGPVHLAFSPDGTLLTAADLDNYALMAWRTDSGAEAFHAECPSPLTGVAFTRDGKRVVVAGYDGTVRFFDAKTGQDSLMLRSRGPERYSDYAFTAQVVFSPDGKRLAGNTWNGWVQVWQSE